MFEELLSELKDDRQELHLIVVRAGGGEPLVTHKFEVKSGHRYLISVSENGKTEGGDVLLDFQ